jgi:hypothetical protein
MLIKTFKLFGRTWTISYPHKVDKEDSCGECYYVKAKIKIKRNLPPEEKDITLRHEQTHAMLEAIGREDLSNDEHFVDQFSRALHQVLTTEE